MNKWIKLDKEMPEDPRLMQVATTLAARYAIQFGGGELTKTLSIHFLRNASLGGLVTLWRYADTHIRDDNTLPCDASVIDAIIGIEGFCDALPNEWVTVSDDGTVTLPGYCEKNSLNAKAKSATSGAQRQRRYRERLAASRNASQERNVTSQTGVTRPLDQDLDQDRKEGAAAPRRKAPTKKPETFLPEDFRLSAELRRYILTQLPDCDVDRWFDDYCLTAKNKQWKYADWGLAVMKSARDSRPDSGHFLAGRYPKRAGAAAAGTTNDWLKNAI